LAAVAIATVACLMVVPEHPGFAFVVINAGTLALHLDII
jgi:hypothetical protein